MEARVTLRPGMSWIAQNWHVVWGLPCFAALIILSIYSGRNPENSLV